MSKETKTKSQMIKKGSKKLIADYFEFWKKNRKIIVQVGIDLGKWQTSFSDKEERKKEEEKLFEEVKKLKTKIRFRIMKIFEK